MPFLLSFASTSTPPMSSSRSATASRPLAHAQYRTLVPFAAVLRIDVDAADVEQPQRHRVEARVARAPQDVGAVPAVLRIDVDAAEVEEPQRHRVEAIDARPPQDVSAVPVRLRHIDASALQ